MSGKKNGMWMAVVALALGMGCGREGGVAAEETAERRSSLFRQAIAAEQAGDLNGAVRLLSRVVLEEPGAASAHFQLATLLQDFSKDYIGAIQHYRDYLALRPDSEKSKGSEEMPSLVRERISKAKELLAPQLLLELGDSVEEVSQAKLMKENNRLTGRVKTLELEKSALAQEKQAVEKRRAEVQAEADRLRKLVEVLKEGNSSALSRDRDSLRKLREEAEAASRGSSSLESLPRPEKPQPRTRRSDLPKPEKTSARPVQRELPKPDAVPAARTERALPKPDPAQTRRSGIQDALKASAEVDAQVAERSARKKTPAPVAEAEAGPDAEAKSDVRDTLHALLGRGRSESRTEKKRDLRVYVVQPGDTLNRIADQFYGDRSQWKKIQEANRTRINPDGRVRAGQQILIP